MANNKAMVCGSIGAWEIDDYLGISWHKDWFHKVYFQETTF